MAHEEETEIVAIEKKTPSTVCIRIATQMKFQPGQFVTISLHVPSMKKLVKRSYSISSDYNGKWLEITIKEQTPGLLSAYAQKLEVGEKIILNGPFGKHFIFNPNHYKKNESIVFIAGGSGIAPFKAMLETAAKANYKGDIYLLYSAKTADEIIYYNEVCALRDDLELTFVPTISRPGESEKNSWSGAVGRISGKLIKDTVGMVSDKQYFVCGPTLMVSDVEKLLDHLGVPKENIKTEKYGPIEG